VGKTTSAASWGLTLSDSGLRTLVVSTDPAHSLGDALQEGLTGVPRLLDRSQEGGSFWAMEIDPVVALAEFQELVKDALKEDEGGSSSGNQGMGGMLGGLGLSGIKKDLGELLSGANDPPPGTDEVVALAKIMSYLEDGYTDLNGVNHKFDRIVLDTAPTGHTIRMLQLPQFLKGLLKKVKSIQEKTGSLGGMLNMMGGSSGGGKADENSEGKVNKLDLFEKRMDRLEKILRSSKDCEFTVVTIPTELAVAESSRLLESLASEGILTRRIIVNQVISRPVASSSSMNSDMDSDMATSAYLNRLRSGQQASIASLTQIAASESISLIKIPYFDMEVRTVYGLRAISNIIFP